MEHELWSIISRLVWSLARGHRSPAKTRFCDATIVLTYLWTVLHDRPVSWACDKRNWPTQKHATTLPTQSTMSRRLRTDSVRQLLDKLLEQQRRQHPAGQLKAIDGKPLPVGPFSHDRQARWGHATKGYARGYKLHALWAHGQACPLAWTVRPMNEAETTVADDLIAHLSDRGVLLADALYDVDRLFQYADQHGHMLLTPRKFPGKPLGLRARSQPRVRATRLMRKHNVRRLYTRRLFIEQQFAHLTSPGGGLSCLPAWVRGLTRVRLWVHAKLILHAIRVERRAAA